MTRLPQVRYDIVPVDGLFLLTDSRAKPKSYLTQTGAIAGAIALARTEAVMASVYVWTNGVATLVFEEAMARSP